MYSNPIIEGDKKEISKVILECKGLAYKYSNSNNVFQNINLKTYKDETVAITAPSGTGKSTLLKVLANLTVPTAGKVYLEGTEVKTPSPKIALIHQSIATFPWMTALDNVKIVLRDKASSDDVSTQTAKKMIKLVGLEGFESSYPKEMSGGMRQRIAIARALAASPTVLLMDEPFVHLDELTANSLRNEIHSILFNPELTLDSVILVSHNLHEIVQLADRVYIMNGIPATIVDEIKIDLPKPRTDEDDPSFYYYIKLLYNELEPRMEA